jgi:hypothetical protein
MVRNKWRLLTDEFRPRWFGDGDEAWYRFPIVSEQDRAPIGRKRLQKLRGRLDERRAVAGEFAQKVAEFLPAVAWLAYMPSSSRRSADSDPDSPEHLFLEALRAARPDVAVVEPFVRASPVPCLHEERVRDVRDPALLRSTLEPTGVELKTDVLYVADDMVQTGATFAAFHDAVRERSPGVRCVLLAMVWSPRAGGMFE